MRLGPGRLLDTAQARVMALADWQHQRRRDA